MAVITCGTPANVMLIQSLRRFARLSSRDVQLEVPTGSGRHPDLSGTADLIIDRLAAAFLTDEQGGRPTALVADLLLHRGAPVDEP